VFRKEPALRVEGASPSHQTTDSRKGRGPCQEETATGQVPRRRDSDSCPRGPGVGVPIMEFDPTRTAPQRVGPADTLRARISFSTGRRKPHCSWARPGWRVRQNPGMCHPRQAHVRVKRPGLGQIGDLVQNAPRFAEERDHRSSRCGLESEVIGASAVVGLEQNESTRFEKRQGPEPRNRDAVAQVKPAERCRAVGVAIEQLHPTIAPSTGLASHSLMTRLAGAARPRRGWSQPALAHSTPTAGPLPLAGRACSPPPVVRR